jgi:hypothetical protein
MGFRLGVFTVVTVALLTTAGGAAAQVNTSYGQSCLAGLTTGTNNSAYGYAAMRDTTTGHNNSAFGYAALHETTSGEENSAFGRGAMYRNTTGFGNTAVGAHALYNSVDGAGNVAIGWSAMTATVDAFGNAAVGRRALEDMVKGDYNVAIGDGSLGNADGVDNNVAIGQSALMNGDGASYNVAVGSFALDSCTGVDNVAVGPNAATGLTSGTRNVALGSWALTWNTTGSNNTAVGYNAGPTSPFSNTGAFGHGAVPSASNRIRIGNDSITQIGGKVAWSNLSDARFKTQVKEDVPGLAFITKLRPVTYFWDERKLREFNDTEPTGDAAEAKKYTGFIAQEVEAAAKLAAFDFSGVVAPPNDKTAYQLSYAEFVVPLVRAVQEQQKEIEELRAAVAGQSSPAAASRWLMLFGGVIGGSLGSLLILLGLERARGLAARLPFRHVRTASLASK